MKLFLHFNTNISVSILWDHYYVWITFISPIVQQKISTVLRMKVEMFSWHFVLRRGLQISAGKKCLLIHSLFSRRTRKHRWWEQPKTRFSWLPLDLSVSATTLNLIVHNGISSNGLILLLSCCQLSETRTLLGCYISTEISSVCPKQQRVMHAFGNRTQMNYESSDVV